MGWEIPLPVWFFLAAGAAQLREDEISEVWLLAFVLALGGL
jgi:hypothetical protein